MDFSSRFSSKRLALIVALALGVMSPVVRTAYAQSPSDKEAARSLMDEGDQLVEEKDLKGALKAYEGAHAIMGLPTTGIEVARTRAAFGFLVEAREMALSVSQFPQAAGEPAPFAEARRDASHLAEALASRIPSIQVVLDGVAKGAVVLIQVDGVELPPAAALLPRRVDPGKHSVSAQLPGSAEIRRDVTVNEGEKRTLLLNLSGSEASGAAGPHARSKVLLSLAYSGFAAGAAWLTLGSITGLVSLSQASSARAFCQGNVCQPAAQGDIDASRSLGTFSTVSFVMGVIGVGLGTIGVVPLVLRKSSAPSASAGLHVTPRFGLGSVVLQGEF